MKNITRYKSIEIKRTGEKLLRLYLREHEGLIADIIISGDFFIMPEEGIDSIESSLRGAPIDADHLGKVLAERINRDKIDFVGITEDTIISAIMQVAQE